MLQEIHVRDFGSIGEATLTLDRVTALTGDSDIGKSHFVRAVLAFVTGKVPKGLVRSGERSCFVEIRTGRAHASFDGKTYRLKEGRAKEQKVTRQQATEAVGLLEIAVAKDATFTPNVSGPLEAPFLVCGHPATSARILISAAGSRYTDGALREVARQLKEAQNARKGLERTLEDLEEQRRTYRDLSEHESTAQQLQAWSKGILALAQKITRLQGISRRLRDLDGQESDVQTALKGLRQEYEQAVDELRRKVRAGSPCPYSGYKLPKECSKALREDVDGIV